jgi:diguanylate cyclase (GGDEF)-like protein
LTGALNRQAFFESMVTAHSRRWSLLAYLDLDGFKKLNDEFGHVAGDESLCAFATRVRKLIRDNDVFARIGGDEFLIYMDVSDEAAAKQVAVRLHLAINGVSGDAQRRIRCSIGVLILPPGMRELDTGVRLADQLMYDAKQRGGSIAVATVRIRDNHLQLAPDSKLALSSAGDSAVRTKQSRPELVGRGQKAAV